MTVKSEYYKNFSELHFSGNVLAATLYGSAG